MLSFCNTKYSLQNCKPNFHCQKTISPPPFFIHYWSTAYHLTVFNQNLEFGKRRKKIFGPGTAAAISAIGANAAAPVINVLKLNFSRAFSGGVQWRTQPPLNLIFPFWNLWQIWSPFKFFNKSIFKIEWKKGGHESPVSLGFKNKFSVSKNNYPEILFRLPSVGGVYTPGFAFAETTLVDRLHKHGVTFDTTILN